MRKYHHRPILYPFIFSLYPPLFMLAYNIRQIQFHAVVRPLALCLVLTAPFFLVLKWVMNDAERGASACLWCQVLFFSFGHAGLSLRTAGWPVSNFVLGGVYLLAGVGGLWLLRRARFSFGRLNRVFNLMTIGLLVFPLGEIGVYYHGRAANHSATPVVSAGQEAPPVQNRPDIYLLVLDSYSRADVLASEFGFDNRDFIGQLQDMGFYVASCSRSNYNDTLHSMASMLNMTYYEGAAVRFAENEDWLTAYLNQNEVRKQLKGRGYNMVTFESEYRMLNWSDVDWNFAPTPAALLTRRMDPFEAMFIKSTALSPLLNVAFRHNSAVNQQIENPYSDHYRRQLYILDKLEHTTSLAGPKFVYAHLILPHRPLVFDAQGNLRSDTRFYQNGDPINQRLFKQGYVEQVEFANERMAAIVREILSSSKQPPIIIVMGDHGYYWNHTNYENLLALYLPGAPQPAPYSTLSNVNVFRLIFDGYFSTHYGLLPDASYALTDEHTYKLEREKMATCHPDF